ASRLARSHGLNFGATEAAHDSLRAEAEAGRADNDYSSLVQILLPEGLRRGVESKGDDEGQPTLTGLDETRTAEPERMSGNAESTIRDDKKIAATPNGDSKVADGEKERTPVVVAESASDAKAEPLDESADEVSSSDQQKTPEGSDVAPAREERRGFLSRVFGR
ncbi:MAG: hypothetical protein H0T11_04165, partial [Chthoniobacterales bacterium]|nr:hypothetical protein [Chthoniobacterales bacterium]